ncbi:MAG TPA: GNAT family N-acetyltransferase [Polyangiaceae bacterium]|nr:GNAT family N-acetyltransferase [Polyangiaceae bacterium]
MNDIASNDMLETDSTLDELAFLNFTESLREFVRWGEGGVLSESEDTLRTQTRVAFAAGSFNTAVFLGKRLDSPASWLETQRAWFHERGRGFSVHTRAAHHAELERACLQAGLRAEAKPPVMVRRAPLEPVPGTGAGATARVRLGNDLRDWKSFVEVTAASYVSMGFAEHLTRNLMNSPERMARPVWLCALARAGSTDCAAAALLFSHSIAGLYWVGTRPTARRQGFAAACVQHLTNIAFERGARAVVLQASDAGAPLYRRMGFTDLTHYPMYVAARDVNVRDP